MIDRRSLLAGFAAVGATGLGARGAAADPPPETPRVRLARIGAICMSPLLVAEELLRAEGFAEVQYVPYATLDAVETALAAGEIDITLGYALRLAMRLDARDPVVGLAGVHTGCVQLFGSGRVRTVRDLKGRRVVAGRAASGLPGLLEVILGQVGLAVGKDVELLRRPEQEALDLFTQGQVDAFLGIPPEPQILRSQGFHHRLLDSGRDRPWAQYFCCMIVANRSFHASSPVAAKRAVRALLKATDRCAADPGLAARIVVDRGQAPSYEIAQATLRELNYRAWRDFDPEEALRFYALRLHEARLIRSSPKSLVADGVDWRILRELKRELKV